MASYGKELIFICIAASIAGRASAGDLPNATLTPGVVNPDVNQSNVQQTVCVLGWTSTVRPPMTYTEDLKKTQIVEYGYADKNLQDYEEDHLIPLALGGHPPPVSE